LYWSLENKVKLEHIAIRSNWKKEGLIESLNSCRGITPGFSDYDNGTRELAFYPADTDLPEEDNYWEVDYKGNLIPSLNLFTSPEIWHFVTERPVEMIELIAKQIGRQSCIIEEETFFNIESAIVIPDVTNENHLFTITASSKETDFRNIIKQNN
jgi:hypothetical protein